MLFHGGAIFDGEAMLPKGSALMVDGVHIAEIAPLDTFAGYGGARTEISGQTLMPGLIDCHAHLTLSGDMDVFFGALNRYTRPALTLQALQNAQDCLKGGVTAMRDCGGIEFIELAVRDACNSGRFLGPTIRAAGHFICMTGGTNFMVARIADGPEGVVTAVREQVHAGCDCIKLMATGAVLTPGTGLDDTQYTLDEMTAGTREARRFNKPVAAHAIGTGGILNAARAGVDSIEHGVFLTDEAIRLMLDNNVCLVPTLAAIANILDNADKGFDPKVLDKARQAAEAHRASVRAYHEAGGRVAMGADTGTPFNRHGQNAQEMAYLVGAGLPPLAAMQAATSVGADLLRLETRGRLKPGHVADMLLVKGDPTADIAVAADRSNHLAVYKDGRVVI